MGQTVTQEKKIKYATCSHKVKRTDSVWFLVLIYELQ